MKNILISRGALPWSGHSLAGGVPCESSLWMGPEVQNNLSIFQLQQEIKKQNKKDATAGSPLCSFQDMGHENRRLKKLPLLSKTLKNKFSTMELRQPRLPLCQIFWRILIYPSSLCVESWIWDRRSPERGLYLFVWVFFFPFMACVTQYEQCNAGHWDCLMAETWAFIDLRPLLKHVFPMPTRPQV